MDAGTSSESLIAKRSAKLDLSKFEDGYEVASKELVDAKINHLPVPQDEGEQPGRGNVVSLTKPPPTPIGGYLFSWAFTLTASLHVSLWLCPDRSEMTHDSGVERDATHRIKPNRVLPPVPDQPFAVCRSLSQSVDFQGGHESR